MNPEGSLGVLLGIVAAILWIERRSWSAPLFERLPPVFWIYLVPMVGAQLGWISREAVARLSLSTWLLPPALFLLLIGTDLRALRRLGWPALLAMAGSVLGMAAGTLLLHLLLGRRLGSEAAGIFASLFATWTGGSVNLLAVAEGLGLSASSQGTAIVVDTLVGYSWMAILLLLVSRQQALDRWLRADRNVVGELGRRLEARKEETSRPFAVSDIALLVGLAVGVSGLFRLLAADLEARLPALQAPAWTVLGVTTAALALSWTSLGRIGGSTGHGLGLTGFYLLLASVGARAELARLKEAPLWLVAGGGILVVHGMILLLVLRLNRLPSFFFGAASQAAVGGYASAPVVAEAYQRGLAPVGLLLAVVGNLVGTYLGLAMGKLLEALAGGAT